MGDRLAEYLYAAFVNSGQDVAGSDVPNWASLPVADRERWEQVAAKASGELTTRFVESIKLAHGMFQGMSAEAALDALRERYGR